MSKRHKKKTRARSELDLMLRFAAHMNIGRSRLRQIHYRGAKQDGVGRRIQENVGDHSWDIVAIIIMMFKTFKLEEPPHSMSLIQAVMYATFHDVLNELFNGDTPAFRKGADGRAEVPSRTLKAAKERDSYERFFRVFGSTMPWLRDLHHAYEQQADKESRLVSAAEKLKADINILLDGGYTNRVLGSDMPTVDLYKRRRIEGCPLVLEWYKELYKIWIECEESLFPVAPDHRPKNERRRKKRERAQKRERTPEAVS